MTRATLLAATIVAIASARAWAEPPANAALTLHDAVSEALRHDIDMQSADAELARARGAREIAGNVVPANPTLTLTRSSDSVFADTGDGDDAIEVAQQFWAPGQRKARIAAADAGLKAALARRDWAVQSVAVATATAFVQASAADRRLASVQQLLDLLRRLGESAARRAAAGEISDFERDQVRLETATAGAELARLGTEASSMRKSLALRIGREIDPTCTLVRPEPVAWPALERLAETARPDDRPDVIAATERRSRAGSLVTIEQRERRPRPSLVLGWHSSRSVVLGNDIQGLPAPSDAVRIDDTDQLLSIGFEVAIPIFDLNRGNVTTAVAESALADAELARARLEARTDLASLVAQGKALALAYEAIADAPATADEDLNVLQRAADAGGVRLSDVLRERERILRARLAIEDVAVAYVETELRLAAAVHALHLFDLPAGTAAERGSVLGVSP